MANAKFTIGQVNITQKLRVIARETANDTVEAANLLYDGPQPAQRDIIVEDLNPVPHYFDFYETPGGATVGALLSRFIIDVGLISSNSFEVVEITVDGGGEFDPVNGTDTYNNASLLNATLQVSQRGFGPLSFSDEIELVNTGGWKYKNGQAFNPGDRFFVLVSKKTTQQVTVVGRTIFSDAMEKTEDGDIEAGDFNCLIIANGIDDILTLAFPAFADIAEKTIFGFNTHSGAQRYLVIELPDGTSCRFLGEERDVLYMGKGEELCVMKKGTELIVLWADGDFRRVGDIVKGDLAPLNSLPETGGWKNIDDYPRFFHWYVALIPEEQLATVIDITNGVDAALAKFAIDLDNDRFWMPNTGGYFERNTDPDGDVDTDRGAGNKPGTKQGDAIKTTEITLPFRKSDNNYGFGDKNGPILDTTNPLLNEKMNIGTGADTRGKNVAHNSYRII